MNSLLDDLLLGVADQPSSDAALDRLIQNISKEVIFPGHVQDLRDLFARPESRQQIIAAIMRDVPTPDQQLPEQTTFPPDET